MRRAAFPEESPVQVRTRIASAAVAGDVTTSVRAFGASRANAGFSVYLDGVKVGVFYAPRPGWWLSTVPTGDHSYEVRDYPGTTTLASLSPVTGGSCIPA
jgi:hypothetical protein